MVEVRINRLVESMEKIKRSDELMKHLAFSDNRLVETMYITRFDMP